MAPRITLIKSYRNKETLRLLELREVAELISQGEYDTEVSTFRRDLPTMRYAHVSNNGTLEGYDNWPKDLPRICFALEQENRNHELVTRGYTGLVLLEVNNLTSYDEAEAVRRGAAEMPQTLMAFVGADGLSVKIVCRGEMIEAVQTTPPYGQPLLTQDYSLYTSLALAKAMISRCWLNLSSPSFMVI